MVDDNELESSGAGGKKIADAGDGDTSPAAGVCAS